jgi:hypothetical protein
MAQRPLIRSIVHSQSVWQSFEQQRQRFVVLAQLGGIPPDLSKEQTSPRAALAFAEQLILCPTVAAALIQILQDRAGTLAFLTAAMLLVDEYESGGVKLSGRTPKGRTPFYVLAATVYDRLRVQESLPEGLW